MSRVPTSWGFVYSRVNKPRGRGARTGSTGVGPTRQPHGPRWTGCTPGSHRPAPWAPRVSHTRGRGLLTAGPHAAAARRARRRPRQRGRREAAPAPLWSPAAAVDTAERRPREGKGRGKKATVHCSPRGDGGDGGGGRSG
uniref:RNA binding protein-like n=1 Tax=Oryza nivara TaxID=4536 RepID=A0A679BCY0_ORYNI|nr:RNA binding protein-like [Oryza sativa f. spontanea]